MSSFEWPPFGPACRQPTKAPYFATDQEFQRLTGEYPTYHQVGCEACDYTGFSGRLPIIESLEISPALRQAIVTGEREMVTQIYLKKGALVPMHSHESEQMTYVLQGAMKFLVGGEEITLREGEVLHIPSWVEHQAEALDDTFELDVFSPIRQDWLDHTDTYFHK